MEHQKHIINLSYLYTIDPSRKKTGKSLYNIEAIVKVQKIAEKYGYTTQFIHNKDGEAVCFAIDAILE